MSTYTERVAKNKRRFKHTDIFTNNKKQYEKEIKECLKNIKIYERRLIDFGYNKKESNTPVIEFKEIEDITGHNTDCIIVSGDFKLPCQAFLQGMDNQETRLSSHSIYYNILVGLTTRYFKKNKEEYMNNGMYEHRALLLRDVLFFNKDTKSTKDIVMYSMPDIYNLLRLKKKTKKEIEECAIMRLRLLMRVCEINNFKNITILLDNDYNKEDFLAYIKEAFKTKKIDSICLGVLR